MTQISDRHRVFFETSADAMLIIEDGVFVDCNQATLDLFGFASPEEFFATHPAEISPPQQPDGRNSFEKANEMMALAIEQGNNRFHWMHQRKNGDLFPVEILLTAVLFEGKTSLHVVLRDVSDRVALENKLRGRRDELEQEVSRRTEELEEALRGARLLGEAVNQSAASILITDPRGMIEYINPAFCEINGYDVTEIIGKQPSILNSGLQGREFYQDMWQTIKSGRIWSGTLKNKRKNGDLYWARLKISPVMDDQGEIVNYVGIETDITDFIEAKERAENANRAKSSFLSSMSHELRTPLNAIMGFSQLLDMGKKNPLSERQKNYVANIKSASDHLLSLIDEVLDLARVEAGKMQFNIQNVNLRDTLDECLQLAEGSYNTLDVTVVDETRSSLPSLKVDPVRLRQVILNLMSNAKKYNVEGGKVFVSGELRPGSLFRLKIRDTGDGIPEYEHHKLFKPFQRLGAEKTQVEGTGIGLLLTKQIVEGMGGEIGFESSLGVGSTFWIDLPAYGAQEMSASGFDFSETLNMQCCDSLHTVLYVEDISINRELMKAIVDEIPNLDLISADTAAKGIELAQSEKPHLIILDINLPDMDGYEAFKLLKSHEDTKNIPVVALSADAMEQAKMKASEIGFVEYLTKPFNMADLLSVLNMTIDG